MKAVEDLITATQLVENLRLTIEEHGALELVTTKSQIMADLDDYPQGASDDFYIAPYARAFSLTALESHLRGIRTSYYDSAYVKRYEPGEVYDNKYRPGIMRFTKKIAELCTSDTKRLLVPDEEGQFTVVAEEATDVDNDDFIHKVSLKMYPTREIAAGHAVFAETLSAAPVEAC